MVAVLEVVAICGQLEVANGKIGLCIRRILCHGISSMLLTAPLKHIFASTKFPLKGRDIVVGGNNKVRYIVFFCVFRLKRLLKYHSSKYRVDVPFLHMGMHPLETIISHQKVKVGSDPIL